MGLLTFTSHCLAFDRWIYRRTKWLHLLGLTWAHSTFNSQSFAQELIRCVVLVPYCSMLEQKVRHANKLLRFWDQIRKLLCLSKNTRISQHIYFVAVADNCALIVLEHFGTMFYLRDACELNISRCVPSKQTALESADNRRVFNGGRF